MGLNRKDFAEEIHFRLSAEDGWVYFLHGWTQVIAEVFDISIPTSGPQFDVLSRIATEVGKAS